DPDAADPVGMSMPAAVAGVPFQLPVRSVRDRETERWLVDRDYLCQADSLAIRLVDDENDIFSKDRCQVLDAIRSKLTDQPDAVKSLIRSAVKATIASASWAASQPKRKAFAEALLTPDIRRDVAQREYFAELAQRFNAADKSIATIKKRESAKKARARAMF